MNKVWERAPSPVQPMRSIGSSSKYAPTDAKHRVVIVILSLSVAKGEGSLYYAHITTAAPIHHPSAPFVVPEDAERSEADEGPLLNQRL